MEQQLKWTLHFVSLVCQQWQDFYFTLLSVLKKNSLFCVALPSKGALFRRASLSKRRCVSARLKRTPYAYCLAARKSNEAGGSSELHSSSIHTGIFISPCEVQRNGDRVIGKKGSRKKKNKRAQDSTTVTLVNIWKIWGYISPLLCLCSATRRTSALTWWNQTRRWNFTNYGKACSKSLFVCLF